MLGGSAGLKVGAAGIFEKRFQGLGIPDPEILRVAQAGRIDMIQARRKEGLPLRRGAEPVIFSPTGRDETIRYGLVSLGTRRTWTACQKARVHDVLQKGPAIQGFAVV